MYKITARFTSIILMLVAFDLNASDWPQFMRAPEHTGDASDEILRLPLQLATQVKLEDAIFASPVVVDGLVYVVDQMGTAYCIDPKANKIIWKVSPDGERAMGGNTSSPCVAEGRLCYGTTAGKVHILDIKDGKIITSVDVNSPITGSLTWANKSLYFQTLGAKVFRMDITGKVLWQYDHYAVYKEGPKDAESIHLGADNPMHGGGEVAVSGEKLVVNIGWDLFCLQDKGSRAEILWCRRHPAHKSLGHSVYGGPVINGEWVYAGFKYGSVVLRLRMKDGFIDEDDKGYSLVGVNRVGGYWAILSTGAVRGTTMFAGAALSKDHRVLATRNGEIYVVAIEGSGELGRSFKPEPFKFSISTGKFIASTPVISGGCVYFGSDDGYLYGLSSEGNLKTSMVEPSLHHPKSKVISPTGKKYDWPCPYGSQSNANYVDDPNLKAPFKLRWAIRMDVNSKLPLFASEEDIFSVTSDGTVIAIEQETGRIRWRRRLEGSGQMSGLYHQGCLYVSRDKSSLYCLDASDGSTRWSTPIGEGVGGGSIIPYYPVSFDKILAHSFNLPGSKVKVPPIIQAYNAETGKPLWQFKFNEGWKVSHCVLDGKFYFACTTGSWKGPGEDVIIAIEPSSGKVLWESRTHCMVGGTILAAANGRVFIGGHQLVCLSAKDGSLLWTQKWIHKTVYPLRMSISPTFFVSRPHGGSLVRALSPDTGEFMTHGGKVIEAGSPNHSCGPVVLTSSNLSLAVSVSGLHVVDLGPDNKIIWSSLGFAPKVCSNVIVASGRIFVNPHNGMLYCFEPTEK